jgi:hypothetical protein
VTSSLLAGSDAVQVGPSASLSSASRSASGAELEEYLGSTPEMLALQQRSASQ